MLTFSSQLSREALEELTAELMTAGHLSPNEVNAAIDKATERLRHYYGKSLTPTA